MQNEWILILGKGYISSKIQEYWKLQGFEVVAVSRRELDYMSRFAMEEYFNDVGGKPKYVINTYGFTGKPNVDSCEIHSAECHEVNVNNTINILLTFEALDIPIITLGTGCIYTDESSANIYTEDDEPNFGTKNPTASTYSKSKAQFEKFFKSLNFDKKNYLLRIRMPFDKHIEEDKNFIGKLLRYDKLINYPNSITYIPDLVGFIERIVEGGVETGIYNVVNTGAVSAKLIRTIAKISGVSTKEIPQKWYTVDDMISMGLMKCRRSNCILNNGKMRQYYTPMKAEDAIIAAMNDFEKVVSTQIFKDRVL